MICPEDGWGELEPNEVLISVNSCINNCLNKNKRDRVECIGFSVLGAGVIPVDRNYNPLYNCISALDNRSLLQIKKLNKNFGRLNLYKITGMPSNPFCVINKIMWFKEKLPDIYKNTWKFINLEAFIRLKWGIEPYVDYSLASSTMALDLNTGKWSEKLLNFADINFDLMPALSESSTVIGEINQKTAKDLGLDKGVKVVAGAHDQVCGALGAGVIKKGIALDSTGTVEAIVPFLEKPILTKKMLNSGVLWEFNTTSNSYIGLAANFTAGSVLRWYRDTFCENEIIKAKEEDLNVYDLILPEDYFKPSKILTLPHFSGSVSPWNDPMSKGVIIGLNFNTSKKEIAKSIIDSITYEARQLIEIFEEDLIKIDELRAIGGASRDKKWLQLKADITGKLVAVPEITEASCLGAAILAANGNGVFKSIKDSVDSMVKINEIFYPNKKHYEVFSEKYFIYKKLYPLLKDFLHEL